MNIIDKSIYNGLELLPPDMQGWNSDDVIFEKLISKLRPSIIVEIGAWKGRSTINMAKLLNKNNIPGIIYSIDTWLGAREFWTDLRDTPERNLLLKNGYPQVYYQFLSNIVHNNVQDYVIPLPMPSSIAAKYLSYFNVKADLIYVDGSHEYEDVKLDILSYIPLLNDNGVMLGDDWNDIGVKQALNELIPGKFKVTDHSNWPYWLYSPTLTFE